MQLGADSIAARGLGDDQHPSGYEAALDPWLAALWSALRKIHPLPDGIEEVHTLLTDGRHVSRGKLSRGINTKVARDTHSA